MSKETMPDEVLNPKTPSLVQPVDFDDWMAGVDDEGDPPWLINRLIPKGSLVLLSGQQKKARKTFFAFTCALALATKRDISAISPGEQGMTLIIEEEGTRKETAQRLDALCKGAGFNRADVKKHIKMMHSQFCRLDQEQWHDDLVAWCKEHKPALVILDSVFTMHAGDENSVKDMTLVLDTMRHMRAAADCAVMYLHHVAKDPKGSDIDSHVRGSSVLANVYDVHLGARRKSDDDNEPVYLTARSRGAPETNWTLRWSFKNRIDKKGNPVLERCSLHMTAQVEEDHLQEHCLDRIDPTKEYTPAQLRKVWAVSKEVCDKVLRDLISDRWLERGKDEDSWRLKTRDDHDQEEVLDSESVDE